MPSESREQKPARSSQNTVASSSHHPPPRRTDPLPCPRCQSTSTKFCYYNNYNFSQPRYFCKSCRRYWTHGGTLRNIPVGGGSRKTPGSSKRHRSRPSTTATTTTTTTSTTTTTVIATATTSPPCNSTVTHESGTEPEAELEPKLGNPFSVLGSSELDLNETYNIPAAGGGQFSTLMSMQGPTGFLNLQGGYGLGLDEMGLGFGANRVWPFPPPGTGFFFDRGGDGGGGDGENDNGNNNNRGDGGDDSAMGDCNINCSMWQMGDVGGGDCYNWPGLVISTPGKNLK